MGTEKTNLLNKYSQLTAGEPTGNETKCTKPTKVGINWGPECETRMEHKTSIIKKLSAVDNHLQKKVYLPSRECHWDHALP